MVSRWCRELGDVEYRAGLLARSMGIQVTGWLHLAMLADKTRFDTQGKRITMVMLTLEGVAVSILNFMIFKNDARCQLE